jgi:hypothetical protein
MKGFHELYYGDRLVARGVSGFAAYNLMLDLNKRGYKEPIWRLQDRRKKHKK